ncbi:MAG: hypothetical protein WC866_01000 [Patescibacteria group bacterium]|jgi:hypothetical protein
MHRPDLMLSREVLRPRPAPTFPRRKLGFIPISLIVAGVVAITVAVMGMMHDRSMRQPSVAGLSVPAPSAPFACTLEDREIQNLVYELSMHGWIQPFEVEGVSCDPFSQTSPKVRFTIVERPVDELWIYYTTEHRYPCKPPKESWLRGDPSAWKYCYKR